MKKNLPSHTLGTLAERCSGALLGDPSLMVRGVCAFDDPRPGCISFIKGRFVSDMLDKLATSSIEAAFISMDIPPDVLPHGRSFIRVADPFRALLQVVPLFHEPLVPPPGVDSKASVASSAHLGNGISIGPFSVIGENCEIGDGSIIHPQVVLYPDVIVGKNCVIHAGAILREGTVLSDNVVIHNGAIMGADGFGYIPDPKVGLLKVPQVGTVNVQPHVEIGANTCVDRGTFGETVIGLGTKIDNLVQVGHNVKIGKYAIICGHTGIAGSVSIGDQVVLGGHTGVADHVTIADGVRVGGKSGVDRSLPVKGDYCGYPILPARRWRRVAAVLGEMPAFLRKFGLLERHDESSSSDQSTSDRSAD